MDGEKGLVTHPNLCSPPEGSPEGIPLGGPDIPPVSDGGVSDCSVAEGAEPS